MMRAEGGRMKKNLHAYICTSSVTYEMFLGVMSLLLEWNHEFKTFPLFHVLVFVKDANFC